MKKNNIIQDKSFSFAVKIVLLYKDLINRNKEYTLSKQLLKSGTSIGANIEESIGAQSKSDFLHKISIAYKEARETIYWIRLLIATNFLNKEETKDLLNDANEICRILGKIQLSIKNKES